MAINRKYISTPEKIETAILQHLRTDGDFKGCAMVGHGLGLEAPETLPCLIVHCERVARHEGYQTSVQSYLASVNATLYGDSEETTQAKFQKYARELEQRLFTTTELQPWFNPPASGRDKRKIRGMYLHEFADWNIETRTEGTQWIFTANIGMVFQSI